MADWTVFSLPEEPVPATPPATPAVASARPTPSGDVHERNQCAGSGCEAELVDGETYKHRLATHPNLCCVRCAGEILSTVATAERVLHSTPPQTPKERKKLKRRTNRRMQLARDVKQQQLALDDE